MFVNNNFSPFITTRPPYAKIDSDVKEEEEEIYYSTQVDNFDHELYQMNLKSTSINNCLERKFNQEIYKYKHSENLHYLIYHDALNVETFDNLSNRKPFTSTQGLGKINIKNKFKLQLTKIYKNERCNLKRKNNFI